MTEALYARPRLLPHQTLEAVQDVLSGKLLQGQLYQLPGRPLQVHAAVAVMLAHRDRYLRRGNQVVGSLGRHIRNIIGGGEQIAEISLTDVSRRAGLHQAYRQPRGSGIGTGTGWVTVLTPPPELRQLVELARLPAPPDRATSIVRQLLGEDPVVLRQVYEHLGRMFEAGAPTRPVDG